MRRRTLRLAIAAVLAVVGAAHAAPATAQATRFMDRTTLDLEGLVVTLPCVGTVEFSGRVAIAVWGVEDEAGGVHLNFHGNPQGVTLEDAEGNVYQGTGVTRWSRFFGSGGLPVSTSFVNRFHLVGRGSAPTLWEADLVKLTVNENGDVTAEIERHEVECR